MDSSGRPYGLEGTPFSGRVRLRKPEGRLDKADRNPLALGLPKADPTEKGADEIGLLLRY
jgi:hypothetical protein